MKCYALSPAKLLIPDLTTIVPRIKDKPDGQIISDLLTVQEKPDLKVAFRMKAMKGSESTLEDLGIFIQNHSQQMIFVCFRVRIAFLSSANEHLSIWTWISRRKSGIPYMGTCGGKGNLSHAISSANGEVKRAVLYIKDVFFYDNKDHFTLRLPFMKQARDMHTDNYRNFLNNQQFSDFQVKCEDKSFFCHRVVLASRSKVFAAMLSHDMKEAQQGFVEIKDFTPQVVGIFLQYLYTNWCSKKQFLKYGKEILQMANKYDVFGLHQMTMAALFDNVNFETAVDLLCFAHDNQADFLEELVHRYISVNLEDVKKTQTFKAFQEKQHLLFRIYFK